ncbi:hypothetical protein PAI11_13260 [Patulibacter medicamentivorans]|uniref:Integral membrane protein n=1 Tax=Patulibacter medicamentivorans TaxID=1097667 RepID=H0E3F8_9ACTN|nr:DUF389 domain-containing protein [Patulibacter medicamentivorans]EHN11791.1 hypothetical protein PAI11_13260 [Patulibacter medicamentivorans]
MIHLRLTVPTDQVEAVLETLEGDPHVVHLLHLPGVASRPPGDAIFCDVPREHASVVLHRLRALRLHETGGIAVEYVDVAVDDRSAAAVLAAPGSAADAVLWEGVEAQSEEISELSRAFLAFMVLGSLLAAVAIFLDSPILMVGAMVVGPEFGPIAAACVALSNGRPRLAARSASALGVGLPLAILAAWVFTVVGRWAGLHPDDFAGASHLLAGAISKPDVYAGIVAVVAGVAGLLSLTTAKSGALVGVLVSVTTIPAAANVGVALGYGDRDGWVGSAEQLALNVVLMFAAGVLTLYLQRLGYQRRLRRERAHEGG